MLKFLEDKKIDTYEHVLLSVLLHQTVGYKKKSDGISISQWSLKSGISVSKVKTSLKALEEKKIIKKKNQQKSNGADAYSRYSLAFISKLEGSPQNHQGSRQNPTINKERTNNNDYLFDKKSVEFILGLLGPYVEDMNVDSFISNKDAYRATLYKRVTEGDEMTIKNIIDWSESYYAL